QTVAFTVVLNSPAGAALGTPSSETVAILDNDPAPTADIEINGVAPNQKNNPGGFVMVNANDDNLSQLFYADVVTNVNPGDYGIPQTRDRDAATPLANADPDLQKITFQTQNLRANGPENIILSKTINGRAEIRIWDTQKKNNQIGTPTNWTVNNM